MPNIKLIIKYEDLSQFYNYLQNFKNKYVSIDFEYHQNKIKLWQICFYNKKKSDNIIFVIKEILLRK
jgi:hypothetical protein